MNGDGGCDNGLYHIIFCLEELKDNKKLNYTFAQTVYYINWGQDQVHMKWLCIFDWKSNKFVTLGVTMAVFTQVFVSKNKEVMKTTYQILFCL